MTHRPLACLLLCALYAGFARADAGIPLDTPVFGRTYGLSFLDEPRTGPAGTYALLRTSTLTVIRDVCGVINQGRFEPRSFGTSGTFGVGATELVTAYGGGAVRHLDLNCQPGDIEFVSDGGIISNVMWFDDGWLLQRLGLTTDFAFLPADGGPLSPWVTKASRRMSGGLIRDGQLAVFAWNAAPPSATTGFIEWFDPRDGGTTVTHQFPLMGVTYDYSPELHRTNTQLLARWGGNRGTSVRRFEPGGVLLDLNDVPVPQEKLVASETNFFVLSNDGHARKLLSAGLGPTFTSLSGLNAQDEWYFVRAPNLLAVSATGAPITVSLDDELNVVGAAQPLYARVDDQRYPVIARSRDRLLLAWSGNRDAQRNIWVRAFSSDGQPLGAATGVPYVADYYDEGVSLVTLREGGLILERDARRARAFHIKDDGSVDIGPAFYPPLGAHKLSGIGGEHVGWLVGVTSVAGQIGVAPVSADGGVGAVVQLNADWASALALHHVGDDFHVFWFHSYRLRFLTDGGVGGIIQNEVLASQSGAPPTLVAQLGDDDVYLGATRTKIWAATHDGGLSARPYDGGPPEYFTDAWPYVRGDLYDSDVPFESQGSRLMIAVQVDGGHWVWKNIFDDGGIFIAEGAPAEPALQNVGLAVARLPDGGLASVATRIEPQPNGIDIVERAYLYVSSADVPFEGAHPGARSGLEVFQVPCGCSTSSVVTPLLITFGALAVRRRKNTTTLGSKKSQRP